MSDKKSFRKSGVVPECRNTSINAPDKLFICLPANQKVRKAWQRAMRRTDYVSDKGSRYCCEDHFDVEKDIKNYMYIKTMKSGRIQMKPGVIPHIFDCQKNRTYSHSTKPRDVFKKREKLNIMQSYITESSDNDMAALNEDTERKNTTATQTADRGIQVNLLPHVRSRAIQCSSDVIYQPAIKRKKEMKMKVPLKQPLLSDQSVSLLSDSFASTSDFTCTFSTSDSSLSETVDILWNSTANTTATQTADRGIQVNLQPHVRSRAIQCSISVVTYQPAIKRKKEMKMKVPLKKPLLSDQSVSFSSDSFTSTSDSTCTFSTLDSSLSETVDILWNSKENVQKRSTFVIEKNPKLYIGIPSHSMFIVDLLSQKCKMTSLDIFVTLKKIKLDLSYKILADDFCLSTTHVCFVIQKTIPLLASYLKPFIAWKDSLQVIEQLPVPFRHRYRKVRCIIDCFEISIQKPSDPILQSLSWSEYKGCNTMKYLIACTPDGLISFVSNGFGGRTTDKMIVEESGFLDLLEPGNDVMADRGFKHLEEQLAAIGNKLVRPPSVSSGKKSSKQEVHEAKRIASLRIHVERVISRIREFGVLKPHAQIHSSLVKYLDFIVQIACGLINVQDYLIK